MDSLDATHPRHVDEMLVQYWQAGLEAVKGATDVSVATDKTRGNGKGLCNAALVLPDNTSMWMVTQADQGKQDHVHNVHCTIPADFGP